MHCHSACWQWTMELVQYTFTLPWANGHWNRCISDPPCLGAMGSGTPAIQSHTACGQWEVKLLECTAGFTVGSGQWNSSPHCLWVVGTGIPATPQCVWAVGRGTPAMHCHTFWRQLAMIFLQCSATPPWGSGRWNSCYLPPYCLKVVGTGTLAKQCRTACGEGTLKSCNASPHCLRFGEWNSCNALPHCLGTVGSGTIVMHYVWGQWAGQLLQRSATLLGGSGR